MNTEAQKLWVARKRKRTAGSLKRMVGRPPKNVNVAAFLEGHEAGAADVGSGEITDCPYKTRLSKRDWWRGYHRAERTANSD